MWTNIKENNTYWIQDLTRAGPSHNAQLLSRLNEEIKAIQDDWCILSIPHHKVFEGDAPTARPVLWDLSLLYVLGSLRLTVLQKINSSRLEMICILEFKSLRFKKKNKQTNKKMWLWQKSLTMMYSSIPPSWILPPLPVTVLQQAEARLSNEVPIVSSKHDFNKFTFQCHIKKCFICYQDLPALCRIRPGLSCLDWLLHYCWTLQIEPPMWTSQQPWNPARKSADTCQRKTGNSNWSWHHSGSWTYDTKKPRPISKDIVMKISHTAVTLN